MGPEHSGQQLDESNRTLAAVVAAQLQFSHSQALSAAIYEFLMNVLAEFPPLWILETIFRTLDLDFAFSQMQEESRERKTRWGCE